MRGMVENVEVIRPSIKIVLMLFVLVVCVPVAILTAANIYVKVGIASRASISIISALIVTFLILFAFMQRAYFGVASGMLTVKSSFYEIKIPISDLVGEPVIMDLVQHPEMAPKTKTNGFSLPGYYSGWYIGHDRRRIFAAIAGSRVLTIKVRSGYEILVSVKNLEQVSFSKLK